MHTRNDCMLFFRPFSLPSSITLSHCSDFLKLVSALCVAQKCAARAASRLMEKKQTERLACLRRPSIHFPLPWFLPSSNIIHPSVHLKPPNHPPVIRSDTLFLPFRQREGL
mmetsp:Transcript_42141/g.83198  ORF Transcript_42141/g.83198 Transcript_42141/m.83198 type:complete len:111 (+) Transcript_42141:179-511(+)